MEKIKPLTLEEHLAKMIASVESMTQEQIDACAWCMGCSGCGWTKQTIIDHLTTDRTKELQFGRRGFGEVMG